MKGKVLYAALLLSPSLALAQSISGPPYIAVHGEAKMEVVPDIFPLEIKLKETSKETASTQAMIESLAQTIVELAKAQDIADGDISVGNLSISPETDYDDEKELQIFLGNTYERVIKIQFRSLEALRKLLSKIPSAKQIQIDTGTFAYSKSDEARRALVAEAIRNARATADEMAKGVGMKISGVHTVSNQGLNLRYAQTLDTITVTGTALAAPGAVVLKEGRITLDQDVYIVYSLAD